MSVVHLVNPLMNAHGGSERRTLMLFEKLAERTEVQLWSEFTPDAELLGAYPIRRIEAARGVHPRGGTIVLVGVYYGLGSWIANSGTRRVILIYNTDQPDVLHSRLAKLAEWGLPNTEVLFASESLKHRSGGVEGIVEASLIDVDAFRPRDVRPNGPFTVGRHSRDDVTKHHYDDPALYARLAEAGFRVRVMGGTTVAATFPPGCGVELLPEGAEPAPDFLRTLDAFVYRVSPLWYETFGRVVTEAMACGLPVVVHRVGGHADHVRHGENGIVFDSNDEAFDALVRIRGDESFRLQLSIAARETALSMQSPEETERRLAFYLREP